MADFYTRLRRGWQRATVAASVALLALAIAGCSREL